MFGCYSVDFGKYVRGLITGNTEFSGLWFCEVRFVREFCLRTSKFDFTVHEGEIKMSNPWEEIRLSDYENHMKSDSVKQLQSMNQTMKHQLNDYDVHTVMMKLEDILNTLTGDAQAIFKEALVGVYLHGSAVMDCFNFDKSDIDLIIVVTDEINASMKKAFMDKIVELNIQAPPKGIELSVVKQSVCKPFIYPTPFELHFSPMHLNWYQSNPDEYIEKMNGEDQDLAAHFTIINHRGKCLVGLPISDVFGPVPKEAYMDSIWEDICEAENEIADNTMYLILNLARVLAYKKEGIVLSKKEGGEWALEKLPAKYHLLISEALADYSDKTVPMYDYQSAREYANYMLSEIKK